MWVISLLGFLVKRKFCSFVFTLYIMTFEPETKTIWFSEKKWILSGDRFMPIFGFNFIPFISAGSVYDL